MRRRRDGLQKTARFRTERRVFFSSIKRGGGRERIRVVNARKAPNSASDSVDGRRRRTATIILTAARKMAGWGEATFTRAQGKTEVRKREKKEGWRERRYAPRSSMIG